MGFECVTFLFTFGLAFLKTLRLFKIFALLRLKDLYRRFSFVPSQYRVDRGVREQLMLLVGNMPTTDGWWLLLETCRSSYLDQCKQSSFLCFSFVAACVLCFVAICICCFYLLDSSLKPSSLLCVQYSCWYFSLNKNVLLAATLGCKRYHNSAQSVVKRGLTLVVTEANPVLPRQYPSYQTWKKRVRLFLSEHLNRLSHNCWEGCGPCSDHQAVINLVLKLQPIHFSLCCDQCLITWGQSE